MQTKYIRNRILKHLQNDIEFEGAVIAEISGRNFSAVDIALSGSQVYRLVVMKHG